MLTASALQLTNVAEVRSAARCIAAALAPDCAHMFSYLHVDADLLFVVHYMFEVRVKPVCKV